jgi:hypothetical protein
MTSRHLECNPTKIELEEDGLGNKGRREYLLAIYERYRTAKRECKKVILSEFCANAGYHHKYAIRLLNGPRPGKQPAPHTAGVLRR